MSCRIISPAFDGKGETTCDNFRRLIRVTQVGPSNGGFETTSVAVAKAGHAMSTGAPSFRAYIYMADSRWVQDKASLLSGLTTR